MRFGREKMPVRKSSVLVLLGFLACSNHVVAQEEIQYRLRKSVTLFGGIALPTGAIAATSGNGAGYAKTGFFLGAENTFEALQHFIVGLEVNVAWLPMDDAIVQSAFMRTFGISNVTADANSWLIVGVLGNVGFSANVSRTSHFYARGKVGLAFGNTPQISLLVNNQPVTQNTASASAFALGFAVGVIVNDVIDIGVHFLSSEPEYTVAIERGGTSTISTFSQPTSIFQLRVGYSISLN